MAFDKIVPYGSVGTVWRKSIEQGRRFYTRRTGMEHEGPGGRLGLVYEPVDQVELEPVDPAKPEGCGASSWPKEGCPTRGCGARWRARFSLAQLGESEEL